MSDTETAEDVREQILNRVDSYFVARDRAMSFVRDHPIVEALADFAERTDQNVRVRTEPGDIEYGTAYGLRVRKSREIEFSVKDHYGSSDNKTPTNLDDDELSTVVRYVQSSAFHKAAVDSVKDMTDDAIEAASYIPEDD